MFLSTKSNTRDTYTATKRSDICKYLLNRSKREKKQTYILMDQKGVRNELLIKVFLLTAVTAIKKIWDNKCLWQRPFRNVFNFLQERCCTLTGKPVFSEHSKNEKLYLNYLEYTNSSFWEEKKRKKTDMYSHGPDRSKKWVIDKSFSIDCCDCN